MNPVVRIAGLAVFAVAMVFVWLSAWEFVVDLAVDLWTIVTAALTG